MVSSLSEVSDIAKAHSRWALLCVVVSYLPAGLLMSTPGGQYVFLLIDTYCVGFGFTLIALLETLTFVYLYGAVRMIGHLEVCSAIS